MLGSLATARGAKKQMSRIVVGIVQIEKGRTISRCFSSEICSSNINLLSDSILACCQIGCWAKSLSTVGNVV